MKKSYLLSLVFFPLFAISQTYQSHKLQKDRLFIQLSEGVLNIIPLSDKAIRIQWEKEAMKEQQDFVLINKLPVPTFKFVETSTDLTVTTSAITLAFNKKTGVIVYRDKNGKTFLSEKAGSRKLQSNTVLGEACFVAEQAFDSPNDEYLFGLGQFQDGKYNLRNISRKLTQVNTQISIPFLYSSRGYGILWHQYGITEFNACDSIVKFVKNDTGSLNNSVVEVTTTSGTQRVSRQQSSYSSKFSVYKEGDYTMMLDLGNMESRHLLVIDDVPCIDQSNLWLPPAASTIVHLTAGTHTVKVICKSTNTPKLSWKVAGNETSFRSVNAKALDYVVFYGNNADDVIADYRKHTGNVPMLPLWAYGFWQCRERYTSGKHLVSTIEEFRKRNLPVDVIVQDWKYWGNLGWGVPQFDTTEYPNPPQFIKQLHDLKAHFSVSVWENPDKKSEVAKEYLAKKLYIDSSLWIDIFNPETQRTHWNAMNKNLFSIGVDSWWMDATEPENDALAGKKTFFGLGNFYRLAYPLFVSKAIYEGQRATDANKRVAILTRSAFAGQQRFGTINWSGDIGYDWDAFKRQIVAGLNYSLTGMPYWTTDVGGFFRPGPKQYKDTAYHDILTRWFQFGTFNSIFRIHGYKTETEPWMYGDKVMNNMHSMLNLRYRLLPYIYSNAWMISKQGATLMRPMIMDFPKDTTAISQAYQYMFGASFLVAPITKPAVKEWNVYLPKSVQWYDFWTGKRFEGGQTIQTAAPLDKLPLFVKAGSIVPMGKFLQYTSEKSMDTLEIRVYTGADGKFNLYNDEGDNYNYEKGKYTIIPFKWNEQQQTVTIEKQRGDYAGTLKKRVFNIAWVKENEGTGIDISKKVKSVDYNGSQLVIVKQTKN